MIVGLLIIALFAIILTVQAYKTIDKYQYTRKVIRSLQVQKIKKQMGEQKNMEEEINVYDSPLSCSTISFPMVDIDKGIKKDYNRRVKKAKR